MNDQQESATFLQEYLRETFSVDTRSLALLRISIALVFIYNLILIGGQLPTFLSESGVLPRALSQEVAFHRSGGFWSILWWSDSDNWTWLCLGVASISGVALLLGCFTRVATAVCLVLLWSFQVRNPLILTAGDILLRMVLVWGLFLPWGRVWSIDGRREKGSDERVTSFAAAGLLIQLACIYFFSGIAKFNGGWSATAIEQTLNLEMYVNGFGQWIGSHVGELGWVALAVLVIEILGPIALFMPLINQYWRGMMMALMWIMHLMIALSMSIGIFSMVACAAWLAFIPSAVWNPILGPPDLPKKRRRKNKRSTKVPEFIAAVLLVYVLLLNIDKIGVVRGRVLPESLDSLATSLMIQQEFEMFADPPMLSPWPQYSAVLRNGEPVNLFDDRDAAYTETKPDSVFRYMRSQAWRRYHFNLISPIEEDEPEQIYKDLRQSLLRYQVNFWNDRETRSRRVETAKLQMNFDLFDESGQPNGESIQQVWAAHRD